ncbi:MAG: DUF968 domain-containing protein [Bacteriovoracaceae bacterium]|nr:DUF968 domain-containing protein [Bacteriovoracaceae bacterium]
MELSKHRAHRNQKYLSWLRQQNCVIAGTKAQCAHHIRLGTNGGAGLKPSDYFCIPLLNEYHTTGSSALHIIGEETFLSSFSLNPKELFLSYLKQFLAQTYDLSISVDKKSLEQAIAEHIELIEKQRPNTDKATKKPKKKKEEPKVAAPSITENEYYQKAKELKRERDKELRKKLKEQNSSRPKQKLPSRKLVSSKPKQSLKGQEFYEKAKEARKQQEKEYREKNKERMSNYRKEMRKKLKENQSK